MFLFMVNGWAACEFSACFHIRVSEINIDQIDWTQFANETRFGNFSWAIFEQFIFYSPGRQCHWRIGCQCRIKSVSRFSTINLLYRANAKFALKKICLPILFFLLMSRRKFCGFLLTCECVLDFLQLFLCKFFIFIPINISQSPNKSAV